MATTNNFVTINIPEDYRYVMLVSAAIAFECLFVGFMAGGKRRKIFNADFMDKFADVHLKEVKSSVP